MRLVTFSFTQRGLMLILLSTLACAVGIALPTRGTSCRSVVEKVLQNQRALHQSWSTLTDKQMSEQFKKWFHDIRTALPPANVASPKIVDIGCGLGIYHVHLKHYFRGRSEHFLVDQSQYQVGQRGYEQHSRHGGFHNEVDKMPFYTSEPCARDIAMANGFNVSNWHWVNATVPNVAALEKVDIVMSLLSWGFHYPIEVYSSTVRQLLKPGGV